MKTPLLVTGGLGFIGSAFARRHAALRENVVSVDLDTYAGDVRRLEDTGIVNHRADIVHPTTRGLIERIHPSVVVHFAAETHVTRSEKDADAFFRSNVEGTRLVLEAAEAAGVELLVHVSTDEVYGPCSGDPFREDQKLPGEGAATSAYARSKALADDVAHGFGGRLPIVVVRPTNCFGEYQHPEKAVPRWITRALSGRRMPVWGDGAQVRDWMHVVDVVSAIDTVISTGTPGEVYNIGPQGAERTNLEMARAIARAAGRSEDDVYLTAYDRPDHDRRYAIDASKLAALGWSAGGDLEAQIAATVEWYQDNRGWWEPLVDDAESLYEDDRERVR